jgi:hypothetical protein
MRRSLTTADQALHALGQPDLWAWTVQQAARWCEDAATDQRWRAHLLDQLDQPVPPVTDLGLELAGRLDLALSVGSGDPLGRSRAAVGAAAGVLAGLPASAAAVFAQRYPSLVSLVGVALPVRAAVVHGMIAAAVAQARRDLATALAQGDAGTVDRLRRFLAWNEPLLTQTVLAWDPDRRFVAIAHGDLERYDAVAVHVAPAGTDVEHHDRFDRQVAAVHDEAGGLGADVLSIEFVWEAPDGFLDGWRIDRARQGADQLEGFLRSLDLGSVRPTLIGLDEGAVVAGLVGASGVPLAAVVALGAPGLGVQRADDIRATSGGEV